MLILFALGYGLGLPVAVIVALVAQGRIRARIATLERQLAERTEPWAGPRPAAAVQRAGTPPEADEDIVAPPLEDVLPETAGAAPEDWAAGADDGMEPPPPQPAVDQPPRAFVFRAETANRLRVWLVRNWFLAVAALSLMLAGVFLVQYGIEQGLLTPFWRVMGAVALGAALVGAGEWVRRKAGDTEGETAFLPSTFAGAGIVVLFVAVLSAQHLYGLIGSTPAFGGLVAVALLAVALGWFYGPFLAAVGVLGATAAPFLVGGSSTTPEVFFYYTAVIVVVGLLIDAVRRWAWVSVAALVLGHGAAWMYFAAGAGDGHYLAFALIAALAATALPPLRWVPRHDGPTVTEALLRRGTVLPEFPARVAFGALLAALWAAGLVVLKDAGPSEFWAALATLGLLYFAATVWMAEAPALEDAALYVAVAAVAAVAWQGVEGGSVMQAFLSAAERPPETAPPRDATALAASALAASALAFWRSRPGAPYGLAWAALAAVLAPSVMVALELWWQPAEVLGAGQWGGHAIAVAAAMTLFAERTARADGPDKRRAGLFAVAALSMISFALTVLLTASALTLALAGTILAASLLDRWQRMPLLSVFTQVAALVIAWRLVAGLFLYGISGLPMWELSLVYLGTVAFLVAAWAVLRPLARIGARTMLESVAWTLAAVYLSEVLDRVVPGEGHASLTLTALVWIAAMAGQMWRQRTGGVLRVVRIALAVLYGLVGFAFLGVVLAFDNPLTSPYEPVAGPPLADSLLIAFAFPALAFAAIAWRMAHLGIPVRRAFGGLAALYGAGWVGLEIRRLWRGRDLSVPGTTDPELYSYTLAMLVVAVALLFLAFARRSVPLRRIAMLGIAAVIAKVFLIDMAGLSGLVRVASFLGLGLSLAALAWINRIMTDRWETDTPSAGPAGPADPA